jgi:hypothetical protein
VPEALQELSLSEIDSLLIIASLEHMIILEAFMRFGILFFQYAKIYKFRITI